MGIFDQMRAAATNYGMSKLSGAGRSAAELLVNLYGHSKSNIGGYQPRGNTGTSYGRSQSNIGGYQPRGNTGARDPLQAAQGREDPLLGIDWYCDLPLLTGASDNPIELGWEMVEEAGLPMYEFEPESNYRAGKMYHYPQKQNLGTLSLKLYEDATGQSSAYIRNWQSLIFDKKTGLYNTPSKYKLPIAFTLFDVAKLDVMIITYTGCWPQNVDVFNLSGGQTERIIPGVTFSVDDIDMSFAKLTSEQASSVLLNSGKQFPDFSNVMSSVQDAGMSAVSRYFG